MHRQAVLAAFVLALCAFSALAQPRLGPITEVSPGTQRESLAFFTFGNALTASNTNYVMSWQDDRSSFPQLYAAMIDPTGAVVVPGTRILVDHRDLADIGGAVSCQRGSGFVFLITSSSLSAGLLITDDQLRRLAFAPVNGYLGSVALECRHGPPLWAFSEMSFPSGPVPHFAMRVVGLSGDAGTFELDGGTIVPDLNVATSDGVGPDIANNGSQSFIVWSGNADGGSDGLDIFGAFVTASDVGAPFLVAGGPGDQANPHVSWNGGASYFVVYEEGPAPVRDLLLSRVSTTGVVLAAGAQTNTPEDEYGADLAFAGGFIASAWLSGAPKPNMLWTQTAPPGTVPPLLLRSDSVDEVHLASAVDGQYFVQYRDFRRGIRGVGQLVRGNDAGAVIDPTDTLRAQLEPQLLASEVGPLASWTEGGARLASSFRTDAGTDLGVGELGARLGGNAHGLALLQPSLMSTLAVRIDAATLAPIGTPVVFNNADARGVSTPLSTPRGFIFATATEPLTGSLTVMLDLLTLDGGVGAHLPIAYTQPEVFNLDVAWASGSDTTGVVWNEHRLVHAQCIRAFDAVTPVIGAVQNVNTGHYEARPRIASAGDGFLVTWVSERATSPYSPLAMAQRLDANCAPLGPALELGEAIDPWHSWPSVVFDGLQYVVVWASNNDVMGDLVGVRIQRNGTVSAVFPVVTQNGNDVEPSLTAVAPGHWGVAFTHFFESEGESARRVFARTIDDGSNGSTCENGGQCESGVCADGVCCNRACNSAADSCETCAQSGVCRPKSMGFECRPSGATCDIAEVCDGTNVSCPADTSGMTCTLCSDMPAVFALQCGVAFTLPVTAIPDAGAGTSTYGLRTCDGTALPNGLSIASSSGVVTWTPPAVTSSTSVLIVAQGPSGSTTSTLRLDVTCTPDGGAPTDGGMTMSDGGTNPVDGGQSKQRVLNVGCGCNSSGGAELWLLIILTLRAVTARRNVV